MTDDQTITLPRLSPDDLVGLAHAAWRHGLSHCVDCGGYHMTWGSMRAAGLRRGLAADEPFLLPRLASALAPGARVLIAGSADPGVLDLVVRSSAGTPLTILVADLCGTPLAVIDELEPYLGIEVRTEQIDLRDLDHVGCWDVIVSHSMLPHVPHGDRLQVLRGLRRALAPNGKVIFVARTFNPVGLANCNRRLGWKNRSHKDSHFKPQDEPSESWGWGSALPDH